MWQVVIGMDVAASEFFSEKDRTYDLNFKEDVRYAQLSLVQLQNTYEFASLQTET
jgi:enolase